MELSPRGRPFSKEGCEVKVLDIDCIVITLDGHSELHQWDVLCPLHQTYVSEGFGLDVGDVQGNGTLGADLDVPAIGADSSRGEVYRDGSIFSGGYDLRDISIHPR